jgi:hypothetical protein
VKVALAGTVLSEKVVGTENALSEKADQAGQVGKAVWEKAA